MALDLAAIVRTLGGSCIEQSLPERTPVDGHTPLETFMVVGNTAYATLVTGTVPELLERLRRQDEAQPLVNAVFVSDTDTPELRAALADHGMTAILGTRVGGIALRTSIEALISDERAAGDRLVTAGMNVLTQMARRGGVTSVIAELAHRIDGWVVLLDTQGHLIASAGAGRLHVSDAVAVALGRPVRVRHDGLQIHQVGLERDLAGYLVIATRSSRTSHSRDLASLTAALLDLLLRSHNPSLTEHLGRQALLERLTAGGDSARELLRRWGVHEPHMTGFALGSRSRNHDIERLLRRWLDELGAEHIFAVSHGRAHGFVRSELAAGLVERVERIGPTTGSGLHLGIGGPAPAEALSRSAVQARQALETALEEGSPTLHYTQLPAVQIVLSAIAEAPRSDLSSLLDPLRDANGSHGELAHTLRVYLSKHGAHRASAELLGIHRQTLVSRIRRIEELTGLSLEHADDRATGWLAIRAAGL